MNSYRAYRWNYEGHQEDFAEFLVTFNGKVILAIQFDGNIRDYRDFDRIGEYKNSSYWKLIK